MPSFDTFNHKPPSHDLLCTMMLNDGQQRKKLIPFTDVLLEEQKNSKMLLIFLSPRRPSLKKITSIAKAAPYKQQTPTCKSEPTAAPLGL